MKYQYIRNSIRNTGLGVLKKRNFRNSSIVIIWMPEYCTETIVHKQTQTQSIEKTQTHSIVFMHNYSVQYPDMHRVDTYKGGTSCRN